MLSEVRAANLHRGWIAVGLGILTVSGVLCTAPNGGAFIGFCIIAVLAAAAATSWVLGWLAFAGSVLSIEVGALIFNVDAAPVWAYPLLLALTFIIGRHRRAYAVQTQQAQTLLAQSEQLRTQQRQVAVLDERNRIAREIHDVLAHSLGALGIQLQAIQAVLEDGDQEHAHTLLSQARRMATDGLVDTRRAVQALRGDTTGLDDQLADMIETHRSRHETTVSLHINGHSGPIIPEATVALTRTAQEALVNAAKHAAHQSVDVDLRYSDNLVSLIVANAIGDLPAAARGEAVFSSVDGGYGLLGMRERLLLIGGILTTEAADHRWTVRAEVPR